MPGRLDADPAVSDHMCWYEMRSEGLAGIGDCVLSFLWVERKAFGGAEGKLERTNGWSKIVFVAISRTVLAEVFVFDAEESWPRENITVL